MSDRTKTALLEIAAGVFMAIMWAAVFFMALMRV